MAEWLRRWTRNPMGSARAGSNPAQCDGLPTFFFFSPLLLTGTFFPTHTSLQKKLFAIVRNFFDLVHLKNTFFLNLLGPLIQTVQRIAVYRMTLCSRNTNNTIRQKSDMRSQLWTCEESNHASNSPYATFLLLISLLDQLTVFIGVQTPTVVLKPLPHHINTLHYKSETTP